MLGTQDLGQVYFEPIKDKHGNALLVLLKDMSAGPNLDGVRWTQLCKLQLHRKTISPPEEPTALDTLLITLHVSHTLARRAGAERELRSVFRKDVLSSLRRGRQRRCELDPHEPEQREPRCRQQSDLQKHCTTFISWFRSNVLKLSFAKASKDEAPRLEREECEVKCVSDYERCCADALYLDRQRSP